MEAIVTRIKGYVTKIYPNIKTDLSIDDEFIAFMAEDAIDRVLSYTNRDQLIPVFEESIEDYGRPEDAEAGSNNKDFWDQFRDYPIPPRLERAIAKSIVRICKETVNGQSADAEGAVKSISDNGQSITFSDKLQTFFTSSDDAEIFTGSMALLDRYRLGNVVNQ